MRRFPGLALAGVALLLAGGCSRVGWKNVMDDVPAASRVEWRRHHSITKKALWTPDGKRLWAVGDLGLILHTPDGDVPAERPPGITWTNYTSGSARTLHAILGQDNPLELLAAGDAGTILRSTDGGRTWEPHNGATAADLFALHRDAARGALFAAGADGTLLRSTDGGLGWRALDSGTPLALYALAGAANGSLLCAAGAGGALVCSRDGGEHWISQTTGTTVDLLALHASADGTRFWAAGRGGLLLRWSAGEGAWKKVASGTSQTLRTVHGSADGTSLWAAGGGGVLLHSVDFGQTWTEEKSSARETLHSLLSTPDGRTVWVLGEHGVFLRTTDGGKQWVQLGSSPREALRAVVATGEGPVLWAVGRGGTLVSLQADGQSWQLQPSGTDRTLLSLFGSRDGTVLCAVGHGGTVIRSVNGGRTWEAGASGVGNRLRSIHGNALGTVLWAVGGGPTATAGRKAEGVLLYSADAGLNWTRREGIRTPVLHAVFSSEDGAQIWAVGESGTVLHSADGGRSWQSRGGAGHESFHAVRGTPDGSRIWIAGEQGTILYGEGKGDLERQRSGTDETLLGLHVAAGGEQVWAVGRYGVILRSADGGRNWYPESTASREDRGTLYAVDGTADGKRLWAVDDSGGLYAGQAGAPLPRITEVRLVQAPLTGARLELRLDPRMEATAAAGFSAELRAADEAGYLANRFTPVGAKLNRPASDTDVWSFELKPGGGPLQLEPGDEAYFEVTLETPGMRRTMVLPALKFDRWGWWKRHLGWLIPLAFIVLVVATWVALLFVKPLALLRLYPSHLLSQLPVTNPWVGWAIKIGLFFTVLPSLVKHPRVLDAWIRDRTARYKSYFGDRDVVKEAGFYLPLPVRIAASPEGGPGAFIERPAPEDFAHFLAASSALIELTGPRGFGKTRLALQIARWALGGELSVGDPPRPMLPLLVEEDTGDVVNEVRSILRASLGEEVEPEFLKALLRRQRLLIVVDAVSERPQEVRDHVRRLHGSQPVNALVVTSRSRSNFQAGGVVRLEVQPLPGKQVEPLVGGLLQSLSAPEDFGSPSDQSTFADKLAKLVPRFGTSAAPPLLVRHLVEEGLKWRRERRSDADLELLLPEAHFSLLRGLSAAPSAEDLLEEDDLSQAAEVLARLALGESFAPSGFWKSIAEQDLVAKGFEEDSVAGLIQALIDADVLEGSSMVTDLCLSFCLPSLAEYLAALLLARQCGRDPAAWARLREEIRAAGATDFMRKLDLVCRAYSRKMSWPCEAA